MLRTLVSAGSGALPSGFQESTVFTGLDEPDGVRVRVGRPRVRRREARRDQGLRQPRRTRRRTSSRTSMRTSTTSGTAACSGWRSTRTSPPTRTSTSSTRTTSIPCSVGQPCSAFAVGHAGRLRRSVPDPARRDGRRLRRHGTPLAPHGERQRDDGPEQVLVEDWCQQYPSHSIGSLAFGADGALYVSGGDGASFNFADYGQDGTPLNPCGDPPGGVGATLTPPTAEGGALRSQDLRTPIDPTSLDGAILRLDPGDRAARRPTTRSPGAPIPNARRIVAHGLRNPFRITVRPGTSEVWVGDVGWNTWEEINRVADPLGSVENFGWPCYEGVGRQAGYDGLNVDICETLYAAGLRRGRGAVLHLQPQRAGRQRRDLPDRQLVDRGPGLLPGRAVPRRLRRRALLRRLLARLHLGDVPRRRRAAEPEHARAHVRSRRRPTRSTCEIGPDGALYYANFDGGTIRRIAYFAATSRQSRRRRRRRPTGRHRSRSRSTAPGRAIPRGRPLAYAWDLDGDGQFDDSNASQPTFTYTQPGTYSVRLRVTDPQRSHR